MGRIRAVVRRDIMHVKNNGIALLVCMGLVVMPSLYAWFNIAGGWDPYENTGQVKVALANSDEGFTGSLIPFRLNAGERVVSSLTASKKIDYVVTSEEDAMEGVRSGQYYAALVIPSDFSSNLLSVFSKSPTHPHLGYYVNEKRNAIASIVTSKASGSVQNMVDEGFTEAVTEAAGDMFSEISALTDNDSVLSLASSVRSALKNSEESVRRTAHDIDGYKQVLSSLRELIDTESRVVGSYSLSFDAAKGLSDAAGRVREFDEKVSEARGVASSAIDAGEDAAQDVEDAIDEAFQKVDDGSETLVEALEKADAIARARRDDLQALYDILEELNGQVESLKVEIEASGIWSDVDIEYTHRVLIDISDLLKRLKNAIDYLDDLIATMEKTIADFKQTRTDAETSHDELKVLAAQAREDIDDVRQRCDGLFGGTLEDVGDVLDDAAADASNVSGTIRNALGELTPLGDTTEDLKSIEDSLGAASAKLDAAADKLADIQEKLAQALLSGDVELVRTIMGDDPTSLASFLSEPVELKRTAFFPVENSGSAMTPYYTTMALWVGGTLMGILIYVAISKQAQQEIGTQPRHAYFGRLIFFLTLGFCQSTMLMLGDVYFLGVQCEHPLLFLLTGWIASTVFINIIYSLATSFGDIGKAIAVFVMVLQVAGSGGTFPVQMLPKAFQAAYPFMPFVHSENAMRAAMFGLYGNDWFVEVGILAAYLIPALLLGLLLRKPFVPVIEWIEEKMEETKLM